MASTKAIVVLPQEKTAAISDVAVPKIRDEWVLVKVKAVGLNPTNWRHIDWGYADAGSRIPYEASLFPGIGCGPFLRSLGGGRRRPPSGGARAISEIPLWKS